MKEKCQHMKGQIVSEETALFNQVLLMLQIVELMYLGTIKIFHVELL